MSERRPAIGFYGLAISLAIPILLLTLIGITTIRASELSPVVTPEVTDAFAAPEQQDWIQRAMTWIGPTSLRQLIFFATGIGLLIITQILGYRRIGMFGYWIYGVVIVLLILLVLDRYVDLPGIQLRRNTRRWIELGAFRLQPSEFMKVALILTLARYLRFRDSFRTLPGLIPPFLLTVIPMALILKQPDLGTLLMLLPVLFAMLFVAGARLRHLALIITLGLALLPVFYVFGMKDYQKQRILVLFRQNSEDERWHTNEGYQLRQGLTALGTGGIFGEGFGGSTFIRRGLLPEEHNDFIFDLIGNQWGLLGCLTVIACYIVIVVIGFEVALVTNDPFGRLLAIGVVVMIVVQALLNICMNIGLAPITGMPLPFVSSGGSSLWANFIALGLLINVAMKRPMLIANPPFEHGED